MNDLKKKSFVLQFLRNLFGRRRAGLTNGALPGVGTTEGVDAAWDRVHHTIAECTEYVRNHQHNSGVLARMEGYRLVAAVTRAGFNTCLMQDAGFPRFRREPDETAKIGIDNPDNEYLVATIDPQAGYRVWGNRGTCADFVLQLYNAMTATGGAALDLGTLVTDDEGNFEIVLSADEPEATGPTHTRNWIRMDDQMDTLLVRFTHLDWETELPGHIHIDHLQNLGHPTPLLDAPGMEQRLTTLADYIRHNVTYWVEFIVKITRWLPPNELTPLRKTPGEGLGLQVSTLGYFDLADDEALIVQVFPTDARYQGFQLGNFWNQSLEYGTRQTSLTAAQAFRNQDDSYHYVVSKQDPGVPNWLDTQGYNRGLMLLRYQGLDGVPPSEGHPRTLKVPLASLRDHLPPETPVFDADQRREQIRRRQRHLKLRYRY